MRQRFTILGLALSVGVAAAIVSIVPIAGTFGGGPLAEAANSKTHNIVLVAESLSNGLLAYRMESHTIDDGQGIQDITSRYSSDATIPGPTIIIDEGDQVNLKVKNDIGQGIVSVHVHGVHYEITSDGTLEHINGIGDQGAQYNGEFSYHWIAGPGTAGTWPYHDHTFGGLNGAENKGLFGTVIVNPASHQVSAVTKNNKIVSVGTGQISKHFVLYVNDDAFWGMEIDKNGNETPLWTNPTLGAKTGDYVSFHLIALGTDTVHEFKLDDYKWLDPGTKNLINHRDIGPLENHAFTIQAQQGSSEYVDENVSNELMGMQGQFVVTNAGASSVASPIPEAY